MSAPSERGQTLVVTVVFLTSLLAMAVAVLDVGSWYRADRAAQAAADAAALAGAQALPEDPAAAVGLAAQYAGENGGGLAATSISSGPTPGDTINVEIERPAPGFFARLFGIDTVTVGAEASARAAGVSAAKWVAPITVDEQHPKLQCPGGPCFNEATELTLQDLHKPGSGTAAGAFGLINLDNDAPANIGAETLGEWIRNGFDKYMSLGKYRSSPGTEFNSSHVQSALKAQLHQELLFPVYRKIDGSGQNAKYDIVAWVGFVPTGTKIQGDKGKIFGAFTKVIWQGIQSTTASPTLGVKSIALVQ